MQLPTLRPREQLLAVGSGLILLAVILDRLVLHPWLHHMHSVQEETRRMGRELKHYGQLLARKDRVDAQVTAYQRYLRAPIADELQMAQLINEVQDLAAQTGVALGEVKPLPPEANELTKRYLLDVHFEATLEQWVSFVTQIETSPSLYQVLRATMATREESPDRLAATLRVASKAVRARDVASLQ